ncbi:unnamed protein product [Nezara viridula]|uniref:Signal-induced proliferation-associated 1-like protein 2 n=1 Tax=Nezara viridula TaxID=85310 RepID=A0A9P0MN62_NEZVI|nr:unnamed protein product [Nezara viridula]
MREGEGPSMALDYYTTSVLRSKVSTALRSSYSDRHGHHHHGQRRAAESLYRSNSSLELMGGEHGGVDPKATTPVLRRREYGSHGSIDVISQSEKTEFLEMLEEYKPGDCSKVDGDEEKTASPKLRLKLGKFWGVKATSREESVVIAASSAAEDERGRRRAFAHFDCRSVTANLGYAAKLRSLLLSRRRNTATGASAASMMGSTTPDGDSGDEDQGDGTANDLLESCPFFRNEIGGEAERVVGLTRSRGRRNSAPLHRPTLACGVSVLEYPPGSSHWPPDGACPYATGPRAIETVDNGALYYRQYFYGQEHQNWFGMDDNLGPVAISLKREKVEKSLNATTNNLTSPLFRYRIVIRTSELLTLRGSILEDVIPNLKPTTSTKSMNTKEVLEYVAPEVQIPCLRLGIPTPQTEEALLKLDEQGLSKQYKVGVMYCKAGQSTEEQMYNNQEAGPAFTEFLETIGTRVRLKGFDKYKAGLDNKTDSTGLYSVYGQYQDCEIMFHVSTLLPFTPNNRQQLLRKRHIGNDIVTIVFQEPGAQPFTPKVIRSQFQHVFIIVRVMNPCTDNTHYTIAVTRSKEVPVFGPPIPDGATFPKSKAFADFILAKVINAENAAHQSEKFATMATRTRQEYLKDLVSNYITSTSVETSQKFSMLSFSSKKKDRWRPRSGALPDSSQPGALSWQVAVDDASQSTFVDSFLAISSDSIVVIEEATREIIFVTPTKSVLGWSTNTNSLRLYYHQGECVTLHMRESGDRDELMEVVVRLRCVTDGSVTQELSLKRNPLGQLGFHVQPDGLVTQVESMGLAWLAGLRQGSRLVEICKVAVSTLSHDQMVDLLKTSMAVTVTVIPPLTDGTPRRGCSLTNCKYNTTFEGDYENVNGGTSDAKSKTARQQAASGNVRKRYERSFSPPRSSNSSGYGTGSSSKSFISSDRFTNMEGTLTSSSSGQSSDERWYEVLEGSCEGEPPPPLPVRLANYLGSPSNQGKMNGFSLLEPAQHEFKVGEKVTCLLKAEKSHELRRQIERSQQDYHVTQCDYGGINHFHGGPTNGEKTSSLPLDCSSSVTGRSDGHSTDTSSTSDRIFGLPSEDELSSKSSPVARRPKSRDTGEARLRPRSQRNSANLHNSTLQQDLIRLISPDYQDQPTPVKENCGNSKPNSNIDSKNRCRERPHSPPTRDKSGDILTMARPATVISASPVDSKEGSRATPPKKTPILLPDSQEMDWSSLVDTATRAILRGDSQEDLVNTEPIQPQTMQREQELSKHISQLETRLSRETRRRLSLEEEVRSLRDENRRLQQESQSAAQQLRRFTEWFFQTIDKQ